MAWINQFSPLFEVPRFIDYLVLHNVIDDLSWHNDSAPSFGKISASGESDVRLWVDHPFNDLRESYGKRFAITIARDGSQVGPGFETDDLLKALEMLFKELASFHAGGVPGVLDWRPSDAPLEGERALWTDPQEYLERLRIDYAEAPR